MKPSAADLHGNQDPLDDHHKLKRTEMRDYIQMSREVAEELECLLRLIARADASHASHKELHDAGIREAITVFADELEARIDDARYDN